MKIGVEVGISFVSARVKDKLVTNVQEDQLVLIDQGTGEVG